jgi:hypothetical protein
MKEEGDYQSFDYSLIRELIHEHEDLSMAGSLELSEKARAELKNNFEKYPGLMEDVDKLPEPLRRGGLVLFSTKRF